MTRVEDPLAGEQTQTHYVAADPLPPVADPLAPHPVHDLEPPATDPAGTPSRRTVREQVTDREVP